jgi:Tfp pilus assembly protein PilZ
MFIPGKNPRPVGTLLRFELRLDEEEPIKGVGEVVWIRPRSQGPEAPSGMGIQFGHIDESNRDRLVRAVLQALDEVGIAESSGPPTEPASERTVPPRRPLPAAETALPPQNPAAPGSRNQARPQPARHARSQASRALEKETKEAQTSPFAISGRVKALILILGVLALLLVLFT